jgi:hypothetical protein
MVQKYSRMKIFVWDPEDYGVFPVINHHGSHPEYKRIYLITMNSKIITHG